MEVYRGNTCHVKTYKLDWKIYYCVSRNLDNRILHITKNFDDAISYLKKEEKSA